MHPPLPAKGGFMTMDTIRQKNPDDKPDQKVEQIRDLAFRILEEIGIRILSEKYLDILSDKGADIRDRRIYFSRTRIRELLASAPRSFTLHAPNPEHTVSIGTGESKLAAGYGCSSIIHARGHKRNAVLADHVELVKLIHQSGFFSINGGILAQPSDVSADKSHLAMHYTTLIHSDKCIMGMPGTTQTVEDIMHLTALRLRGEAKLKQTPAVVTMVSPVSPLQVDEMLLNTIETAARYCQPVMASPGIAAGTTGPIDLASNVAVATAESLATILMTQMFHPGTPVIFGIQCYGADMTTGNISIGSPAYALQARYCAALGKHLNLPTRAGGATTDARSLSAQAGYESMLSMFTAMQNQVSLIVHSAGILDSFAGISFEKLIVDLEIIRMVRFYLDDMEVSNDTLNFDLIREIGPGGLFLTAMDTLKKCRTHAWTPAVSSRGPLNGLSFDDKLLQNIEDARQKMLAAYEPPEIDPAVLEPMNRYMVEKGLAPDTLPRFAPETPVSTPTTNEWRNS
jgi:trimethylamine--corrinoid protein Co-methyltransferase